MTMCRYYDSIIRRHLDNLTYEGLGVVDLNKGQFLCPVCRRLSNALVPIVPKEALQLPVDKAAVCIPLTCKG